MLVSATVMKKWEEEDEITPSWEESAEETQVALEI